MTQKRDLESEIQKELELYGKYDKIENEYLSGFRKGTFTGTAIKPQWIIQALTETFGLCGIGWYYIVKDKWIEWSGESEAKAFVEIELFYKIRSEYGSTGDTWSMPVQGMGGNTFSTTARELVSVRGKNIEQLVVKVDDDCYKKAETDALGKACQKLGFGASIYMGTEKTKYEDVVHPQPKSTPDPFFQNDETRQKRLSDIKEGADVSREDAINIISDEYIKPEFRKALREFVKSVDKKSHDELSTEQLVEFLISQNK